MENFDSNYTSQVEKTGGFTLKKSIEVDIAASSFSMTDNIGGIIKLENFLRHLNGTGIVHDIAFWDNDANSPELLVDFWREEPVGSFVSGQTQDITGNELIWLGCTKIQATDWVISATVSRCHISPIGILINSKEITDENQASRDIFITIQASTSVNYDTGLTLYIGQLQD